MCSVRERKGGVFLVKVWMMTGKCCPMNNFPQKKNVKTRFGMPKEAKNDVRKAILKFVYNGNFSKHDNLFVVKGHMEMLHT